MQTTTQQRLKIAIVGASGGIGNALYRELANHQSVDSIYATYNTHAPETVVGNDSDSRSTQASIQWSKLDVTDEDSVRAWFEAIPELDWIVNCVGMLHTESQGPEKTIQALSPEHFMSSMAVNCMPTLLIAKYAKKVLKSSPQAVFATISARVGSISDNRLGGWYSYRSSKAALNMALKCLAIEWGRTAKNVNVVALHPGTTDSDLSKPFQKNVPEGQLFSAEKTASLLIEQLFTLRSAPSGQFIAYDGSVIPW